MIELIDLILNIVTLWILVMFILITFSNEKDEKEGVAERRYNKMEQRFRLHKRKITLEELSDLGCDKKRCYHFDGRGHIYITKDKQYLIDTMPNGDMYLIMEIDIRGENGKKKR